MPALQRAVAWAEERLLGALRQYVPQNGRVHLHIIERGANAPVIGNRWNTVSRVLFRGRELTEPH